MGPSWAVFMPIRGQACLGQKQRSGHDGALFDNNGIALSDTDLLLPGRTFTFRPAPYAPSLVPQGFSSALFPDHTASPSDNEFVDSSEEWIKQMLLPQDTVTHLPQHEHDLAKLLFPEQPGKLPVIPETFLTILRRRPGVAEKYLISADGSVLPVLLSELLSFDLGPVYSEMNVSALIIYAFQRLVSKWHSYGSRSFPYKLVFYCNKKTGDSHSDTTRKWSRPDTLLTASAPPYTFLVGEDKCRSLTAAKSNLERKMQSLSVMFYGKLQFILGYTAAGNGFQWVYISKYGNIRGTDRRLDLSTEYRSLHVCSKHRLCIPID